MTRVARDPETSLLLDLLAEAFERKSWHGTNLRGSFRGMTAAARAKVLHLVRGVAAQMGNCYFERMLPGALVGLVTGTVTARYRKGGPARNLEDRPA